MNLTTEVRLVPHAAAPTSVIVEEMEWASSILMRAEAAISREFEVLRAGGVHIDFGASMALSVGLVGLSAQLALLAMQCKEAAV